MSHRSTLPIPSHPDVVITSEQRVWSGRFPLDVVQFRHRRFDGTMSATRIWELWRRGHAAALLPYDPVADAVVLIEQFRFPALAAGVDPTLVELPAGLCEDNEDPVETIRREMHEEMAMEADRVERIGGFMLTAGGADEFCHLYVGRVTAPPADDEGIPGFHWNPCMPRAGLAGGGAQNQNDTRNPKETGYIVGHHGESAEGEDIRVRVWDANEAIAAAFAGYFTNSITAIGLFWLASKRDWLRQKWMTA